MTGRSTVVRRSRAWIAAVAFVSLLAGLGLLAGSADAVYEDQFTWPMDGEVTSEYWECRDGCDRYHRAIDVANGCDTDIYAARAGTANVHVDAGGYGNYVTVDHRDGWSTLYAHMDDVHVSDGDEVTRDTVLGDEGSTGSSTGCHVHFEIRQSDNGDAVKAFLPGEVGDEVASGANVPVEERVLEATSGTELLDGPNVDDVPGEGDETVATADAGDRFATYGSWTNGDGGTWHAVDVNGRTGWIAAADTVEVSDTLARIQVDSLLNVREGPGTSNADVGDVHGAEAYPLLDTAEDPDGTPWLEIPYDDGSGGTGWIHSGFATPVAHGTSGPLEGEELFLDPGHGGDDPGATADGVQEKDVVLDIALEARDRLVEEGATVVLARVTDETVSLEDRTDAANRYEVDRFVSVHANSCGGCGAQGTETYYHESLSAGSTAADLSQALQDAVVEQAGTEDRGVKQDDFHVLRESDMPASLVETAFIDDEDDQATLTSDEGQADFARGIHDGVLDHLDTNQTPAPSPLDALDEDFEAPLEGWTVEDETGPATWERTTQRAGEGTTSMALRDYGADEHDHLETPPIDLAGDDDPRLVLDSWMEGEQACGLFGCTVYDAGTIEVTDDGGDTWTALEADYWDSDGWETLGYELDDFAGEVVRVRFTFESDGATENEGWYVDHVAVFDAAPLVGEGFEAPLEEWTVEDETGPATWERTTQRAAEGTTSMALRDYGADEHDHLETPPIDLTDRRAPELVLDSWMEGEQACGLFGCTVYDAGTIEVTDDGGTTWRTLVDDYWDSDGWETLSLDLAPEAGETVQLRFTFESDGATENEGWYMDDVRVG